MWDPVGQVGGKITGPGHGLALVNIDDWQGAVASAPLSHQATDPNSGPLLALMAITLLGARHRWRPAGAGA
jgi:hypothetical protein